MLSKFGSPSTEVCRVEKTFSVGGESGKKSIRFTAAEPGLRGVWLYRKVVGPRMPRYMDVSEGIHPNTHDILVFTTPQSCCKEQVRSLGIQFHQNRIISPSPLFLIGPGGGGEIRRDREFR